MNIDFHTHGKLAKKLPLSIQYVDWLFDEARKSGLDAICLTEHFNTLQFDELYDYINSNGENVEDAYIWKNGLKIFTGMETDILEGGHILSIGPMDAILELNSILEPHKEKEYFLNFDSLMDLFSKYPVIIGAAHPFRSGGHIPELSHEQLSRLDFLDLNGKDMALDRVRTEKLTNELSKKINKPILGGSDTHQAIQFGCIKNKFDKNLNSLSEIMNEIHHGNYETTITSDAHFKVETAGFIKKLLKNIHSLGGDYVSMLVSSNI